MFDKKFNNDPFYDDLEIVVSGLEGENPKKISEYIFRTEKEIAQEKLNILKARFEKEKSRFEKSLLENQHQILELRSKLEDAASKIKTLDKELDQERQINIEQV